MKKLLSIFVVLGCLVVVNVGFSADNTAACMDQQGHACKGPESGCQCFDTSRKLP